MTHLCYSAALFKVGTGEDISKAPAPGMFDLKVRITPLLSLLFSEFYSLQSTPFSRVNQMLVETGQSQEECLAEGG